MTCPKCQNDAPIAHGGICRECWNARAREWRTKNRAAAKAIQKRHDDKRATSPERIAQCAAQSRRYRAENKEAIAARKREYERENRAEINAKARAKYAADMKCYVYSNVRAAVRLAIIKGGGKKARRTSAIIGYPLARLVEWARRNGYGKGKHIDHIIPVKWWLDNFPLDVALRKAWQLSNLRVISAGENQRKGAAREFLV